MIKEVIVYAVEALTDNVITIAVIGTGLYMFINNKEVPEALIGFMGLILAYYFNKK